MAAPLVRTILSTARLSSPRKHFKNRSDPLKSTYFISRLFSSNDTDATEPKAERPETHFGFESVPEEEKENKVKEVFSNVASTYDLMNDVMSAGLHRVWKDIYLERLSPAVGTKLLDVAGGTGDIAHRFLKRVETPTVINPNQDVTHQVDNTTELASTPSDKEDSSYKYIQNPDLNGSHVTVCDINENMLEVGRNKFVQQGYTQGISWIQGNAESLPFSDGEFDAYTIAFGIRNCTHVQQVLDEAYRVLKPGGRFLCLEFSEVPNIGLRSIYDTYSFQVIPVMGHVIASDWKSYQYLVESIRKFPNQEDFANMIKASGFRMVTYENLTFGVVAIHSGFKI